MSNDSEYELNYSDAVFDNYTGRDMSKNAVFELLFEDGVTDSPSIVEELRLIDEHRNNSDNTVNITAVVAEPKNENTVWLKVEMPDRNITVPGSRNDATKVAHSNEIPYKYYVIQTL